MDPFYFINDTTYFPLTPFSYPLPVSFVLPCVCVGGETYFCDTVVQEHAVTAPRGFLRRLMTTLRPCFRVRSPFLTEHPEDNHMEDGQRPVPVVKVEHIILALLRDKKRSRTYLS